MRKPRAIIIDDEQMILDLLTVFLTSRGYEVFAVAAPECCPLRDENDACRNRRPCSDVLLTDYRMPAMTGIELLVEQARRECKLDIRNKAVITGFLDIQASEVVRQLGCRAFDKPIVFSDLAAWLTECEQRMDLSQPLELPRREKRLLCDPGMVCDVKINHEIYRGVAVNRSASGLCLKVPRPLPEEQIVTLLTALPLPSLRADVRWIRESGDGGYLAGMSCC
jgi:CheY-like chemotaxis protein